MLYLFFVFFACFSLHWILLYHILLFNYTPHLLLNILHCVKFYSFLLCTCMLFSFLILQFWKYSKLIKKKNFIQRIALADSRIWYTIFNKKKDNKDIYKNVMFFITISSDNLYWYLTYSSMYTGFFLPHFFSSSSLVHGFAILNLPRHSLS